MSRIRLMIVSEVLTGGGAERFVSTLLQYIDRERFAPVLCLLRNEITYPLPDDVPLLLLEHDSSKRMQDTAGRLARLIREHRIDQVLTNIPYTMRYVAEALRINKTPVSWVARLGNNPAIRYRGWKQWRVNMRFRRDARQVQQFVCNATAMVAAVEGSYPALRGRTQVIANPTDFDSIDARAAEPVDYIPGKQAPAVLHVGRLHRIKRVDMLLQAFARLRAAQPAELWICGDGDERVMLEAMAETLGIADSIRWLGFRDNPYALMKQADLFVLTSDSEGLPNALIEAQGLGMPAVSTRCPYGPEDIIEEGETGFLTPTGDAVALADGMQKILSAPALKAAMAGQARRRTREKFSALPLVQQWQALLETSCHTFKGTGHD